MKTNVFDFKFSDEDREILWNHIKKDFGPKKATAFVDWLQVRCSTFTFLKDKSDWKIHHNKLQRIINHLKQALKYINEIGLSFSPFEQRTFADTFSNRGSKILDSHYHLNKYRTESYNSLKKMIEALEMALKEQPIKTKVKGVSSSFVKALADDYETILESTPTEKGHFFKFVQLLFSVFKLPSDNPIRAIREALKARK